MNTNQNHELMLGKLVAIVLMTFVILLSKKIDAQIYNYDPVRHTNFETNPSFLASDKNNFSSSFIHQGALFDSHRFYYNEVRTSLYSQKYYTGIGLTINNTNINDSVNYRYAGIGIAYRVILFDKIHTRIGCAYKILNVKAPGGIFTYYKFNTHESAETKQHLISNANISISFSSAHDNYYLSGGIINFSFTKFLKDTSHFFPQYYFLNIGDFAKMLSVVRWELSYTMFGKNYHNQNSILYSHYLSVLYTGFAISRNSGIRCGARIGVTDHSYMQCTPLLSFYHRTKKRKNIVYQLSYDFGVSSSTKKLPFNPTTQFNLTYQF